MAIPGIQGHSVPSTTSSHHSPSQILTLLWQFIGYRWTLGVLGTGVEGKIQPNAWCLNSDSACLLCNHSFSVKVPFEMYIVSGVLLSWEGG